MSAFKKPTQNEIDRINRIQSRRFDELYHLFEPPLPEGVPERLERIAAEGKIEKKNVVLDVGSGTGILVPMIRRYHPSRIYACDLSEKMLERLKKKYPMVITVKTDVRKLYLAKSSVDAVFINACYPNISDKPGAFQNIARMSRPGGRMVISHPLGKRFVKTLKRKADYPLDEFPSKPEAENLFGPFGFHIQQYIDEPDLFILVAEKAQVRNFG